MLSIATYLRFLFTADFPASCLIALDTDSCWYDECQHKDSGFEYVYPFPTDDDLKTKCAKWLKWEEVHVWTIKNKQSGTLFELYQHTETTVKSFLPQCFVKWKQAESYEIDKAAAQSTNSIVMMLQMDYVENHSCRAQDEVQTAH